jgi:PST family polysaccharide transporter
MNNGIQTTDNMNRKVTKATAWSSVTEIAAKIVTPVVNIILARLLMPEAFGIVAVITMVISFAEVFTDAGFQKYIVQREFESEDKLNKCTTVAFWTNLSLAAVICLIIFFFRHGIATLVGSPDLGNVIALSSLLILVSSFSSIQMARYRRAFDFKTLFFVRTGGSLIPLVVTVPLALVLRDYRALLIGTFASYIFNAVVLTAKSKWKPSFYFDFKLLKEMFSFSIWSLFESVAIWLTSYVGVFIVGSHLSEHYLGIYRNSMSTVNSLISIITAAVTPVLFAALSRNQNNDGEFKRLYYQFQRLTAVIVMPMGVGMYLFSDLITYILLGEQWMEASGFIGLWSLTSSVVVVFSYFSSEVYRSKGEPKISLLSQVIHLAFLIPILSVCIGYGFEALYTARSLIRLQGVAVGIIIMQIRYKFKFTDVVKNILPMAVSTVIMGVAGYFLRGLNDGILWQFCSIAICVVIYFGILFTLFPKVRREIMGSEYVKNILSRFIRKRTK